MGKWKDIPVFWMYDISLLQNCQQNRRRGKYKIYYEGNLLGGYKVVTNLPWKDVEEWFKAAGLELRRREIATSWEKPKG